MRSLRLFGWSVWKLTFRSQIGTTAAIDARGGGVGTPLKTRCRDFT